MSTWAGRPRLTFTRRYATETKLGGAAVRGLKPIVGEPTIRGLKPTAKFSGRYAAEMRLQPTTNGSRPWVSVPRPTGSRSTAHGFPFHGVGIPKSTSLCAGNHDTAGLKSSRVASATVEFSPAFQRRGTGFNPRIVGSPTMGFNPRIARTPNAPVTSVTVEYHPSGVHADGIPALPGDAHAPETGCHARR